MAMSREWDHRFCFLSFKKHQFFYSEACITSSKKYLFIYLIVLSLRCFVWNFSTYSARVSCCGGFFVSERRYYGERPSVSAAYRLYSSGSIAVALGLVAPHHVGSSQIRGQTRVPCAGSQILNHWTTKEVCSPTFIIFIIRKN